MSGYHVNVVHNGNGSDDWVIIECEGDKIYEGHRIGASQLMDILEACNGFEFLHYYSLTDEQLGNWPDCSWDMEPTRKIRL